MKLADVIPNICRADIDEPGSKYLYQTEVDLTLALAAVAEQCGLVARTQVPTSLNGFADMVVNISGIDLVIELKMDLTRPAQLRRAAEQVLGYQRFLQADQAALLSPRTPSRDVRVAFKEAYPEIIVWSISDFQKAVSEFSSSAGIAERLSWLLGEAQKMIDELPSTDRTREAYYGVGSARRVLAREWIEGGVAA